MYDKWNLNRFPFYTRPIDKINLSDFAGREREIKELSMLGRSEEGVAAVIGERGVGTTSVANYCRFKQKGAFTFKYEIRIEQYKEPLAVLEAIIYSIVAEMRDRKIQSKAAKAFLDEYNVNEQFLDLKADFVAGSAGVGRKSKLKSIFPVMVEIFTNLVGEITKRKEFSHCIFQLNNFDVTSTSKERVKGMLNVFRDIFHTPKTVWYLLGDGGFEALVQNDISRVSSIIRHWVMVRPLKAEDFPALFKKRVKNSGVRALCPFTDEAIMKLAEATLGRPRFALDVAGKLVDMFGDQPLPEILTKDVVEKYAKTEIKKVAELGSLSEVSIKILEATVKNPGEIVSSIAQVAGVSVGNFMRYALPLEQKGLVRIVKDGRAKRLYPIGLGQLI